MKLYNFVSLLFLSALLVCSSCETFTTNFDYAFGTDQPKPDSVELSELQFDDVPVPKKFKLKISENESYSFETINYRSGSLNYVGSGNREEIVEYYRNNMPAKYFGWQEMNHISSGKEDVLSFRKENYECVIRVREKGSTVYLTIFMNTSS